MEDVQGTLGGFRGLRAELLVALKKWQPLTAAELGDRFGLTANALRRHLKVLDEDGLVMYRREVRGVGSPVYSYQLTAAGEQLFPCQYASVLAVALEALRTTEGGSAAINRVLDAEWDALVEEAEPVLSALPLDERLPLVAELLTSKGYMAEVHPSASDEPDGYTLSIHNCPLSIIIDRFPEICEAEARMMERMVGVPLTRGAHRLAGCTRCEYRVRAETPSKQHTNQT